MAITMLVFSTVIVAVALLIFRHLRHANAPPRGSGAVERDQSELDQAMRLLAKRFALGEIDSEEITQRRDILRTH